MNNGHLLGHSISLLNCQRCFFPEIVSVWSIRRYEHLEDVAYDRLCYEMV